MPARNVVADPEMLGSTLVFIGTRVPVRVLFEHLEAGDAVDVFLDDFPSVSRALVVAVLAEAGATVVAHAHAA